MYNNTATLNNPKDIEKLKSFNKGGRKDVLQGRQRIRIQMGGGPYDLPEEYLYKTKMEFYMDAEKHL